MVEHRNTIATEHPDSVGKHCSLCNGGQNQLEDLSGGHRTYLREMRNRLERDAELAVWIREEIGAE